MIVNIQNNILINKEKIKEIKASSSPQSRILQKKLHQSIKSFSKYLALDIIDEFSFQTINVSNIKMQDSKITEIMNKINSLLN